MPSRPMPNPASSGRPAVGVVHASTSRRLRARRELYILRLYNHNMSQVQSARPRRINMRVSERQEQLLRAAAQLSGETLTGFVLAVATERAEQVLERAHRIDVSGEAFQRFVDALDSPPEDMPVLRRYATEASPIPER